MARGRQKQLDRMDKMEAIEQKEVVPFFHFREMPLTNTEHLSVKHLSVGYHYPVLSDIDFAINGGQNAGILAAKKDAEVIVKPLADGGEGTTDALIEGLKGERVDVTVTGPYHESVQAYYGYLRESNTAVMEMATAAGITLSDKKEPMTLPPMEWEN